MELETRKLIVNKYIENPTQSGSEMAKMLKLPKTTICRVIKRYKESLSVERSVQVNRKHGTQNKQLNSKVLKSIKTNPGLSDYDLAKKHKASRTTVRDIRVRAGYKKYRAIKQPNRSDKQNIAAKKRARLLYDNVLTKFTGCVLMDDETYVKLDFKQIPGQKFYSADARGNVPPKFKFVKCDKFAKKCMIWQAICSCGRKSKIFITEATLNSDIYIEECLRKCILPLIRQHNSPVKFWPDLASCHYSKKTLEWYGTNNIDVIPKDLNPPNCPQFRPIEKYWAIVKAMLKKDGGRVENANEMRKKWNKYATKVTPATVQNLMAAINKNVRDFIHNKEN